MLNRNFTPFPILITGRLTLRQLLAEDKENIFALRSDPEINKYLDRHASKTMDDAINFIGKINSSIKKNDSIYWAITLTYNHTFVGTICLFNFSNEKNKCEIGYELLKQFQGQGIMKEATETIINYSFQTLQLQIIEAYTHTNNKNSTTLLEKCNFRKSAETDKENSDINIFTLTNSMDNFK